MMRRRPTDDRGAMTVLIAILLSAFLLGFGAIVLDVGQWHAERAQLQNGADAGAVAMAQACAASTGCPAQTNTTTHSTSLTDKFANVNANDNTSNVDLVCGSSGITNLTPCTGSQADGSYCPAAPPNAKNWVDVHTSTKTSSGTQIVPALGSFLGETDGGKTINTCAQAAWGPVGSSSGLALGMSLCAWLQDVNGTVNADGSTTGTYATPGPPYTTPGTNWPPRYPNDKVNNGNPVVANVGGENVVQITGAAKACSGSPSGLNIPGGFGWLSNTANGATPPNCVATTNANGYVYSNTGGDFPKDCQTALANVYGAGLPIPNTYNPVYVPVFDMACNSSGKLMPGGTTACPAGMPTGSYHIAGYATFVVTGYDINPVSKGSMISTKDYCNGGDYECIYGFFTKGLVSTTGDIGSGGTDFGGPTVVEMTG